MSYLKTQTTVLSTPEQGQKSDLEILFDEEKSPSNSLRFIDEDYVRIEPTRRSVYLQPTLFAANKPKGTNNPLSKVVKLARSYSPI